METGWRRNYLRYKTFFLNMMTQYRERSDWRVYLEILLSLATVSVFSIFALRPTILTIAELMQQIEEKKSTVAAMDEKIQTIGKAQVLYDRESAAISILTGIAVPGKPNSDIFARQMEGLSSKHQVSIATLTMGEGILKGKPKSTEDVEDNTGTETESSKQKNEINFSAIATASVEQFESLAGLAKDFENLSLIPKISVMDLSLKEGEISNKILVLLFEGSLPYLYSDINYSNPI